MSVWDELVGQEHAVQLLRDTARVARHTLNNPTEGEPHARMMTHAWLITGPPGSGRSVAARAFAAALQCTGGEVGCGDCPACRTTLAGTNADVLAISTEKMQIAIDEARLLLQRAQVAPSQGRWRVIIVEDADRMSERTSNVLLKGIEEPPPHTVWLLCAPSPDDMIATIRSRCRHLGLKIPSAQSVADLLVSRDGADPAVALEAAQAAQSHIGLARALARDPELRKRRCKIMEAPARVRSVGEAVLAAGDLLDIAQKQADSMTEERNMREKAELLRQFGVMEGERPKPQIRAHLRRLEDEQKRRGKRALVDTLDRALIDLLALYRDVLMVQLETGQELININQGVLVEEIASASTNQQTLARVDAIETARRRLRSNTAPLLTLEAMTVALCPQTS